MSRINNMFDLTGFVGADPEIRYNSNTGKPIVLVSLGVDGSYKKPDTKELVEHTDWIDLTVYREGLAGVFEQYVKKSSEIHVRGYLRKQVWESRDRVNEDGTPKRESRIQPVVTEVRLLRRPKDSTGAAPGPDLAGANAAAAAASIPSDLDDDIPF
ncbi:single-stranded DNA-binding protein [Bordetella flabilis]|uniref:Single-stranded DNA-binding protein n=1 Tax=Bordetella flabilis TaxID=463014 RepID=A0A193GL42_9BORD|nr:single-stranded DNA-binding protein [Bordetella flabilis]ANN80812.1 hypothetical protein BAU07_26135 [Bordetella flabilis]